MDVFPQRISVFLYKERYSRFWEELEPSWAVGLKFI